MNNHVQDLQNILNDYLNINLNTSTGTGTGTNPIGWENVLRNTIRQTMTQPIRSNPRRGSYREQSTPVSQGHILRMRELDVLDTIMYDNYRIVRDYNYNIQMALNIIGRNRSNNHNVEPYPVPPIPDPTPSNSPDDTPSLLFSYVFTPAAHLATQTTSESATTLLTREEISRTTRTYGYTEDMIIEDGDENANRCPITLDNFQIGDVICEIRGCGHIFKRPSLMNWLRRNSRCPMCRYELRNYLNSGSPPEPTNDSFNETTEETETLNGINDSSNVNIPTVTDNPHLSSYSYTYLSSNSQNSNGTANSTRRRNTSNANAGDSIMRLLQTVMRSDEVSSSLRTLFDISANQIYEFDFPLPPAL
jgi:hypothetical protein